MRAPSCPARQATVCYHGGMGYLEWYENISARFRSDAAIKTMGILDRGLVAAMAVAYIAILVFLLAVQDPRFAKELLVPAATFGIVTAIRAIVNAPRPYELFDIDPIIRKDTKGKSMPSRHVSSAFIIAFAIAWINPALGAVAIAACACVCFTRIVGGVHFPRDVAVAATISIACGIVGFLIVP